MTIIVDDILKLIPLAKSITIGRMHNEGVELTNYEIRRKPEKRFLLWDHNGSDSSDSSFPSVEIYCDEQLTVADRWREYVDVSIGKGLTTLKPLTV